MSTKSTLSQPQMSRTIALAVAAVLAASRAQAAEPPPSGALEEITVFGVGEVRQVSELTAIDIATAVPGTSAIKVLDKLPGVSFQSSDPFGAYEWSTRISVRGFSQNQMGFTLDGIPLGDMSYGNHNGLHISRAISSENIGNTVLSQGAGSLGTSSSSNLGGTIAFYSRDPAKTFGADVQLTAGANSTKRGFARLDTGEMGTAGTRAYLSYTKQDSEKWRGEGKQKQEQINVKIVQPIGEGQLSAFYDHSDRAENDYQDVSLAQISRLGYNWDNLSGPVGVNSANWQTALAVSDNYNAGGPFPAPFVTGGESYFNASGLRKDTLAGAALNLPVSASASWNTTVYLHKNKGEGVWFAPGQSAPVGAPDGFGGTISDIASIAVRTTEYSIDRNGITSGLAWTAGAHKVEGGIWYEKNDFDQARRYYGLHRSAPQRDSLEFMKDPYRTKWQFAFNTKTTMFYLQDTWEVNDALKVTYGFKSLDVKNEAVEQVIENTPVTDCSVVTGGGTPVCGSIEAKKSFLPQVGFNYKLGGPSELFGDVTRNMRAFANSATAGVFSASAAGLKVLEATGLNPETSTTFEFGWRYNTPQLFATATVYFVDFKDRLLVQTVGSGIAGNQTIVQNVGDVRTKGAEVGLAWRMAPDWNWYNSLSYNDSTYQDDVVAHSVDTNGNPVTDTTYTGGKTIVDSPKEMVKSELGYDNSRVFAKLAVDYTGSRFYTYTNDQQVPAYTLVNLSAGYHWSDLGFAKKLTVQGNVYNLTDKQYVATVGSNGFKNAGDSATLQVGSLRQFFISVFAQF